jgi:hypothetical protein
MFKSKHPAHKIIIAEGALESIFDECDLYDSHETGGRLVGSYRRVADHYEIHLHGVIGPGPQAQRTAVSFFQDGNYQENVFRKIEELHPEVEHLGNWHTHHCNGLATLSGGDHETYHRTVNHEKHNTDFFYALLVVKKNHGGQQRYQVKHFVFHRNSSRVDEVPHSHVHVINGPVWWAGNADTAASKHDASNQDSRRVHSADPLPAPAPEPHAERVKDQQFFSDFYPHLKAHFSKSLGALYWKGPMALIDGSQVELFAIENSGEGVPTYSIKLNSPRAGALREVLDLYQDRQFESARQAVMQLRDNLNHLLFTQRKG